MLLTRRRVVVILPHRLDSSRGEAGARQGKAVRPATEDVVPLLFYSPLVIRKSIGHYNRPALAIYRLHYVHRLSFSCLSCLSSVKSIFSISRYTEDKCYATAKQRNGHASPAARQNNSERAPQFIDMRIRVGISKESLFLFFLFCSCLCDEETDAKLVAPVIRLSLFLDDRTEKSATEIRSDEI
jgi:hypothetical protein